MSYENYGSIATNGNTFTFNPTIGSPPPKTPSGLITTRAVETKDGWLGQVIVDKDIVFETAHSRYSDTAIGEANKTVVDAIKGLFKVVPKVVASVEVATTAAAEGS